MKFQKESLETCSQSTGVVVVIDVIRAFTTAAFAFASGAKSITLVSTVEEALDLRGRIPNALVMGEENGLPPEGFDYGNSPFAFIGLDLSNYNLIQRTSAGTQGVVNSHHADILVGSSFCCARATVEYVQQISPEKVTFVITGLLPNGQGDEDLACAEYLEALLKGTQPDPAPYLKRVLECWSSQHIFADPEKPQFPWQDIECCTDLDRFDFAMRVNRENGRLVMTPF